MPTADYLPDDVTALAKEWVKRERESAKENGERPVYWSRVPDWKRAELYREGEFWYRLATGIMLEQCVPRLPTASNIASVRDHITRCCSRLRSIAAARGDLLPEGLWPQLETAERRVVMALDIVENAPAEWSREADAAWAELTRWARNLDMNRRGLQRDPWEPEG
ncbi:hypothetical protein [Streptomyces sp. 029-5]|uniref:hypothetical protein n=1 Tax=Streptomyces sp. 029-5 TaxID=2789261 RepID=UPI00398150D0